MSPLEVAVIGCGLIGRRRAEEVAHDKRSHLHAIVDAVPDTARSVSQQYQCLVFSDWREIVSSPHIDIVVVATPNASSVEIAVAALRKGKHLLVEKPFGCNLLESEKILKIHAESEKRPVVKTGFNHRFHPAILKAKKMIDEGAIGKIMTIRARYGHGGRPGMESEWRCSKADSGGGELLDQGVHLIDLIRWFAGGVVEVFGKVETLFWDIEVEDNAFAVLKTESGVTAAFHVSWTNWRNIFSFELFGTLGYLTIEGLGKSYGPERLEWGRRPPEGGYPQIDKFEFPGEDSSWQTEWNDFLNAIVEGKEPLGTGRDGYEANKIVEAIYQSSQERRAIQL